MRENLAESSPHLSDVDEEDIYLRERNIKQCKRKICDGHYTAAFGVRVVGGSEAILHSVNLLIEAFRDDVGLSMLLVDFKNAFNLVDREGDPLGPLLFSLVLHPLTCKIIDSFSLSLHAWYLDDGTIFEDTMVVGNVLELIMEDGPGCGLHLNVDKIEFFGQRKTLEAGLHVFFSPNIARPLHDVKLLGGPASMDFDFCNELVMKLYFTMRTCLPRVFESAQRSFDVALRSSLERDDLNYAFLASRLQSAGLQTKLLRHTGIVSPGPIFDDALSVLNTSMETDLLSNPRKIISLKLMRKMADIYFIRVTKNAKSTFSLSP
nr:hypothetical protein [Tanacetum cinerariifolium]